jgi:hypothetical protein
MRLFQWNLRALLQEISFFVTGPLSILIDGDALFSTQGRAEDISLALLYHLNRSLTIRGGYRILEGGADNDEVYTFSLFNYALIGITYKY